MPRKSGPPVRCPGRVRFTSALPVSSSAEVSVDQAAYRVSCQDVQQVIAGQIEADPVEDDLVQALKLRRDVLVGPGCGNGQDTGVVRRHLRQVERAGREVLRGGHVPGVKRMPRSVLQTQSG